MEDATARHRRTHSADLKAQVVVACAEPRVSVTTVALARGLSTNLVHKRRRQAVRSAGTPSVRTVSAADSMLRGSEFIALPLLATVLAVRHEIGRGATSVAVHWPLSVAGECAAWLGNWLW